MIYNITGGLDFIWKGSNIYFYNDLDKSPCIVLDVLRNDDLSFKLKYFETPDWSKLQFLLSCEPSIFCYLTITHLLQKTERWSLAGTVCCSCNIIGWHSMVSDLFTQLPNREISSENKSEEQEITKSKHFQSKSVKNSQITTRKFFFKINSDESLIVEDREIWDIFPVGEVCLSEKIIPSIKSVIQR